MINLPGIPGPCVFKFTTEDGGGSYELFYGMSAVKAFEDETGENILHMFSRILESFRGLGISLDDLRKLKGAEESEAFSKVGAMLGGLLRSDISASDILNIVLAGCEGARFMRNKAIRRRPSDVGCEDEMHPPIEIDDVVLLIDTIGVVEVFKSTYTALQQSGVFFQPGGAGEDEEGEEESEGNAPAPPQS